MKPECQARTRHDCLQVLNGREKALEPLRQSELVVIGGTGFVGTWIAEMVAALNDDYQFGIKLSLISRSTDQFASRLPHLANRKDVQLIKSDVRQLGQFPMDADWVIHAAANPDVRTHATNPLDTASVIVDGTMSVMRTAERLGRLKKLLYLSSGLVCGTQPDSVNGLPENAQGAPRPDASFMYPNAKRFAETICSAARLQSRIPVLIARPFSFIGPYQSLDTPWAQTTFLADALRGKNIRVLGDGQVVRSYLYGSDAAYWFLRILTSGQSGDVVNVGSPVGITLQDLAKEVAKSFEPSPEIMLNTSPRSVGRSSQLLPDTTRAQNEYGLSVFTPLEEAIKLTVQWHLLQNS
ncbi:MAG: NAD(P)-dependent oxidoreductase [Methylotenera sp.]|nr:NAD(P)-dependent oxidoreductase [Methylotenera sp.]